MALVSSIYVLAHNLELKFKKKKKMEKSCPRKYGCIPIQSLDFF